jgi:hypothetical protein
MKNKNYVILDVKRRAGQYVEIDSVDDRRNSVQTPIMINKK